MGILVSRRRCPSSKSLIALPSRWKVCEVCLGLSNILDDVAGDHPVGSLPMAGVDTIDSKAIGEWFDVAAVRRGHTMGFTAERALSIE